MEKMNFEIEEAAVEDVSVEEGEDEQVAVEIRVTNPANLIGFRGRNLAALQTILGLMVKKELGEWVRVILDVNDYRKEQRERLEKMAKNLAQKVIDTGKSVEMVHMSSYERRICHMAIADMEGIASESEGEGEERHVVIKLKEV